MTWGVGPGGFLPKPLAQILADINAYQLANISSSLDVQPSALMGVLKALPPELLNKVE